MKKATLRILFLIILTFSTQIISAQLQWTPNMQTAKAYAITKNKFIVIDFWATWCGPCKKLEHDFWQKTKIANSIKDRAIYLKADIDNSRNLAIQFGVRGIPDIVVSDLLGNKLVHTVGFQPKELWEILESLPTDISNINKASLPFLQKKETEEDYLNLGKAYQYYVQSTKHKALRNALIHLSNKYLKKVKKQKKNLASLHILLNKVYQGKTKNINKKLAALALDERTKELQLFVRAYAAKIDKNTNELEQLKQQIVNKKYLEQLK